MTSYTLRAPLAIGPRLTPALIVAPGTETYGTISAELVRWNGPYEAVMEYTIDTPGGAWRSGAEDALIIRGVFMGMEPGEMVRKGLALLLSYLSNEADVYRGSGQMGACEPDDGWTFDVRVAEWCYLNSDEIAGLSLELSETE